MQLHSHLLPTLQHLCAAMAIQDTAVGLSGILKSCAIAFMKIANDLRWMNSGPQAGLSEIELPALQPASLIIPGNVNPVIPEAAAMVAAQVIGNDAAITMGGQSGNFELNVMLPMIASNLLSILELLASIAMLVADEAITGFKVNGEELLVSLTRNPVPVTALTPLIGYARAAQLRRSPAVPTDLFLMSLWNTRIFPAEHSNHYSIRCD